MLQPFIWRLVSRVSTYSVKNAKLTMMQPATTFWRFLTTKKKPKTTAPATTLPTARTTDFNLDGPTTNDATKPVVIEEEEESQDRRSG